MSIDTEIRTLTGRAALVTGGGRGIGRAIALDLARTGADVAVTYVSGKDAAQAVVAEVQALGQQGVALAADNTDGDAVVDAVDAAAAAFGRLDVLVNNAGVFAHGVIDEVERDEVDHVLSVHVRAVYLASQAALRHLGPDGRIVSIGSNLAERTHGPGVALYAMSKSALSGFTRGLARDVGDRGITVNLVQPGSTDTDMNPADGDQAPAQVALSAVGHYGTAADVAGLVAFLAGPGGRQVTGTTLTVDGGANA